MINKLMYMNHKDATRNKKRLRQYSLKPNASHPFLNARTSKCNVGTMARCSGSKQIKDAMIKLQHVQDLRRLTYEHTTST